MSGTYRIDGPVQMFEKVSQNVVELFGREQHVGEVNRNCKAGELDLGGSAGSLELVLGFCPYYISSRTRAGRIDGKSKMGLEWEVNEDDDDMGNFYIEQVRARHVPLSTREDENDVCLWLYNRL